MTSVKTISGKINRAIESETLIRHNDFAYRIDNDFLTWPEELHGPTYVGALNDSLRETVVPGTVSPYVLADVCCDEEDNFFVTLRNNNMPIVMFNNKGKFIKSLGKDLFGRVHGITVSNRHTLFVADDIKHVIREIDYEGKIVKTIGRYEKPCNNGYDENVFVNAKIRGDIPADTPYDPMVECMLGLATIKIAGEPFYRPTKMVQGPSGDLYASDGYCNAAIHRFTPDGKLIKTWGGPGKEPGKFWVVHGLWVDKYERIWVADRENNRVQVFSRDGKLLMCASDINYKPSEIWADDEFIYVGEQEGGITIFNMNMDIVAQLGYYLGPLVIHGICGDSKSNLIITTLNYGYGVNIYKLNRI